MKYVPHLLLIWRIVLAVRSYINCYDVAVWRAEMSPIILIVIGIIRVSRSYRFSSLSYIFMAVLIYLHTIWAHYTFERVPFDRFTDFFGFERNHYDRIAHFSVGFYAYAIIEYLEAHKLTKKPRVSIWFAIFAIFTVASVYEIIERIYAVMSDPEAGIAFLWSQWDIWDAQKDMLADGSGALVVSIIWWIRKKFFWKKRELDKKKEPSSI